MPEREPKSWKCICPPELEATLKDSAARQGRNADEVLAEAITCYFDEEARFVEAVRKGGESSGRGEYLTHEQVEQRLERFLRP
jgi:predicted transcriptional regulator